VLNRIKTSAAAASDAKIIKDLVRSNVAISIPEIMRHLSNAAKCQLVQVSTSRMASEGALLHLSLAAR
jgi:hypothetical protein